MNVSHGQSQPGPSSAEQGHGSPPGQPNAPYARPGQPPPGNAPYAPVPGAAAGPSGGAFGPPVGLGWSRVSRRLPWHRRIMTVLGALPIALVGAVWVAQGGGALGVLLWLVLVVVSCGLGWIVAELSYRSLGYAERPDDLVVTGGVLVRRLVVVPYGRMQFVDVTAGLLERWMGIATVRLHTAAAATDARIPGLPAAEAARLRDRLAQRGEERNVGL
jgi:membrane protein YdbS with pleckstrin-like domain